jgi:ribosomal protein S27AE
VARWSSLSTLEGRLVMGMVMLFAGAAFAIVTPTQSRTITESGGGTHSYEAQTFTVVESSIRLEIVWVVSVAIAQVGLATATVSLYGIVEPQIRAPIVVKSISPPANSCPTCGQDLTLVKHYRRWYCWKCRRYRQPLVICEETPSQVAE